jgi:hypothetical protein
MIVAVTLNGPAVLEEQADFKGLKVTLDPADTLARALELLGAVEADEADHVWIPADGLRALAVRSADWDAAFAAMLAKVEPFGWYDSAAARVKAHVERTA